ncbi:MAG: 2-oxoacid:acceptor oxidoreductase family protein [Lentisphaeria bacterium]|nr:2-oxoacid:acceptor oxidoreductase family protein [Lentisphaeria bacterium]
MSEKVKFGRSPVFFETFNRRPGPIKKNMHYCPGCGHGILHKLIAEAVDHYGIQKNTKFISPVGCAVFAYYYFNFGNISVPHGRAPAVATGVARANPEDYVISYQGDGDLAAIGFNEFLQAANRGENITVFFVNNSNYGMTGGQMAPTTLPGQKTTTSPYGRNPLTEGYPTPVCEIVNALTAPVYIERVALTTPARIAAAKRAVYKGIQNLKERKGFSLIEVVSPCPVNLKMSAEQVNEFIEKQMMNYFPLGVVRDKTAETESRPLPAPVIRESADVEKILFTEKRKDSVAADFRNTSSMFDKELRVKIGGFGGQGILSLGVMLANMGMHRNFNVSWMPSYGPEQRGGSACCSVIVSRKMIPSPILESGIDLMIATTQTALEKYLPGLKEDGILIYDSSAVKLPELPAAMRTYGVDAIDIAATQLGSAKCANSVLMGVLAAVLAANGLNEADQADFDRAFAEAVEEKFGKKPGAVEMNVKAYEAGKKAFQN